MCGGDLSKFRRSDRSESSNSYADNIHRLDYINRGWEDQNFTILVRDGIQVPRLEVVGSDVRHGLDINVNSRDAGVG